MLEKVSKNATLEDLKSGNETLYNAVFALGRDSVSAELETLKKENSKLSKDAKIRDNAYKLGLYAEGEKLITEDVSLENALSSLIQMKAEGKGEKNTLQGLLEETKPKSAGAGSEGNSAIDVQSKEQAISKMQETGNYKNKAEATKAARRAYPELFIASTLKGGN